MAHSDLILDAAGIYASGKGYRFGVPAYDSMRYHASNAGAEIDRLPTDAQGAKLNEAKDNFAKLIDEMIKAAQTIPGYQDKHPDTIGEDTLLEALGKLCPIWPFC